MVLGGAGELGVLQTRCPICISARRGRTTAPSSMRPPPPPTPARRRMSRAPKRRNPRECEHTLLCGDQAKVRGF
jgi:hypothetical protein